MPRPLENVNFGIFGVDHTKKSACTYYRVQVPLRALYDLGLSNHYIGEKEDATEDKHIAMLTADIVLLFSMFGSGLENTIETIKGMKPGWNNTKTERIYPPSMVFDVDDNFDYVHPFNEAFIRLGTRDYSGRMLKKGDILTTTFEKDGTIVPLWEDEKTRRGPDLFDIERNLRTNIEIHRTAKRCDGVTVPSPTLARYLRETHNYSNVYVYPNSIIPEDYPQPKLMPHEGVRILWQGGGSHMIDWFPLRDALREVSLKYPQVKWVIWGSAFKWIHDNIPEKQLEYVEWVPYEAYKVQRTIMDCDISLCPLKGNDRFNESKSGIKFYEACMPAEPEVTLASNAVPYSDEITDGETGLLYNDPKEFVEKLGILIENAELRKKLAHAGREWVLTHRHYKTTAPGLMEFYKEIRARKTIALEA
jgi:glycosyltransferase involved in cell wall biosynthesis